MSKSSFVSLNGTGFVVNNRQVNCSLNSAPCNFRLTCSGFQFIGTNAYWLPVLNSDEDVNSVLGNISLANITVVRTWAFNDVPEIPKNGTWFQLVANGNTSINLNETTGIPKLDRIISMAEQHGIYLLLSLTNNWNPLPLDNMTPNSRISTSSTLSRRDTLTNNILPRNTLSNDYGGMDAYVRAFGAKSHDAFYTNEAIIAAFENYTSHIVSRYVNRTAILGWELANDPRCKSSIAATPTCNTTTITEWHARIASLIRSIDPNHLVSSGTQGFFCTDCPKLFQNPRNTQVESLTKKRILKKRNDARKKTRASKLLSEPPTSGVRLGGKWIATPTRRQEDAGTGSAFNGSEGVDFEDILSIAQIGFGSFQLFPDQNSYMPDDPNLSAFNYSLLAGLNWIQRHGELGQQFGKPVTLSAFGLVTQDNAPSFVPFNSTIAPFANNQIGSLTLGSATQLPFGVTDQQRDDAYAQWVQQAILSNVAGMIQYQWGQGNLTAVNGTAICLTIDENGIVPVQSHKGVSPSDGYSIAGFGTSIIKTPPSETPPSADTKSQSNLGAIVGGVVGGLAVIALGVLFLWRYLRRVHAKSQNERIAVPARLLFDTRELPGHSAPTFPSTPATKRRLRNNTSLPTNDNPTIPTEPGPNRPVQGNEPPVDNSRPTNSRNFESLENRLATLEALVVLQRPPPYVDNDDLRALARRFRINHLRLVRFTVTKIGSIRARLAAWLTRQGPSDSKECHTRTAHMRGQRSARRADVVEKQPSAVDDVISRTDKPRWPRTGGLPNSSTCCYDWDETDYE